MTTRRTLYLPVMIAAAVLLVCAAALLAGSQKAEATFRGHNGKIAYASYDGNDYEIYTINAVGGISYKSRTTIRTTSLLPTRPTATGSPIRAPTTKSTRLRSAGEGCPESPTTIRPTTGSLGGTVTMTTTVRTPTTTATK